MDLAEGLRSAPDSGRDYVKSLQSSYTGLYPQSEKDQQKRTADGPYGPLAQGVWVFWLLGHEPRHLPIVDSIQRVEWNL